MMTDWIISSSVLIVLTIFVRFIFKEKISQRLRYALWLLVLIRLLVPFSLGETELSVNNITQKAARTEDGELIKEIGKINLPKMTYSAAYNEVAKEYADKGIDISKMPLNEYEGVDYEIMGKMSGGPSVNEVLKWLWITGFAIVGGCFILSNLIFASKLKKRRVVAYENTVLPIYTADNIDTPCLFGIFRPAVYVTGETMDNRTALRHVVEHELTHYRHGDNIWAILRGVCLALHWYNPLVWAAAVMSKNDAELACDEAVIKRIGEGERAEYGRTLIMMTCEKRAALFNTSTTMTGSGRTIKERISHIVKKPKTAAYTLIAVAVISIIAALMTFTGADKGGQNFYEWTSSLTADDIETAQVSKLFGVERHAYTIPKEDYQGLVNIFNDIKAEDFTNDRPTDVTNEDGYMLALYRGGKLWLFKAMSDASVWLMFEDAKTGAIYGCEGSLLIIESSTLLNYIKRVTDEKGTLDTDSIFTGLTENEIKDVEAMPSIDGIEPYAEELLPILKNAAENPVEPAEGFTAYWNMLLRFMNDSGSIILSAGLPENHVRIFHMNSENADADLSSSTADTGESLFVNDKKLYDYVRNTFNVSLNIGDEINAFRHILDNYIADFIAESNRKTGTRFTSADMVQFDLKSHWDTPKARYDVFEWDIALYSDDPLSVSFSNGAWLDSRLRVRDYMTDNYFAVKTDKRSGKSEQRILPRAVYEPKQGIDVMYVDAEFGGGFEKLLIDLAYDEALTYSDRISKETATVTNNGNGISYTVEYPIANTSSAVGITMVRRNMSWEADSSEIK